MNKRSLETEYIKMQSELFKAWHKINTLECSLYYMMQAFLSEDGYWSCESMRIKCISNLEKVFELMESYECSDFYFDFEKLIADLEVYVDELIENIGEKRVLRKKHVEDE